MLDVALNIRIIDFPQLEYFIIWSCKVFLVVDACYVFNNFDQFLVVLLP